MYRGTRRWPAVLLALLASCAGWALAQGPDDVLRSPPHNPANVPSSEPVYPAPAAPARLVSTGTPAPATDLQARVAELEARLDAIAKKETAQKEKAAGHPSVKAGGRIILDYGLFGQGPASRAVYGDVQDGVEFRRARIFLSGEGFHVIEYKMEFDFVDTDTGFGGPGPPAYGKTIQSTSFKDVYLAVKELPYVGHVRVGHFKEPFGLEYFTSANYITFMERSMGDEGAFVPGRRIGVMAYDTYAGENGTWAIGAFAPT